MRFDLFSIVSWHESIPTESQAYQETLEQIELAEQVGFDGVWLGEHHFSRYGLASAMFSLLGAVASRTKRVRIGTAVIVVPFHNPILVAEETSLVDILSGGRLELGFGSGYQRQEFDGVGVNIEESRERFWEGVEVIAQAWSQEKLTFRGKFTNVTDLEVLPKPVQKPGPPRYVAVSTSPASVEAAAKKGMTIMLGGPTAELGQIPEGIRFWREKMEQYGYPHTHIDPPVSGGNVYVAPTMEEAENPEGEPDFMNRFLRNIGSPAARDGKLPQGYESWANRQADREVAAGGRLGLPLTGTPEVVAERLEIVRDKGIGHLFSFFGYPGMPHKKIMRSIELFGTKVIPHFRKEAVKSR